MRGGPVKLIVKDERMVQGIAGLNLPVRIHKGTEVELVHSVGTGRLVRSGAVVFWLEADQLEVALTHQEHCKRARPARPCTCHDLNFGGSCFNCGFDPNRREVK
jgi:hypothetical protein